MTKIYVVCLSVLPDIPVQEAETGERYATVTVGFSSVVVDSALKRDFIAPVDSAQAFARGT